MSFFFVNRKQLYFLKLIIYESLKFSLNFPKVSMVNSVIRGFDQVLQLMEALEIYKKG